MAYTKEELADADAGLLTRFVGLLAEEGVLIMPDGRWYICGALNYVNKSFYIFKTDGYDSFGS